jgi:hypothetical protein
MASVSVAGTAVAAVGVDHVRLSYHYLDQGDLDGYESLFDPPQRDQVRGRRCSRWHGVHDLLAVFAADGRVVAVGRFSGVGRDGSDVDVAFVDVFSLSEHGLLVDQRCSCSYT